MLKHVLAAALAAALIGAPTAPAWAQAATEKTDKQTAKKAQKTSEAKPARKLTPQQQKMKDCGAKWQVYKKEKKVSGRAEYRKFQSTCLKA